MLLADLRRPIASLTLTGSLLAIIAIVTSSLGHTWLTVEVSTVFLTVRQNVGLFSINQYTLLGGGGTRERATMTQTTISDWQHQLCDVYSTTTMSGPFPGSGWVPGLDPPNDNRVLNGACTYIETLRWVGIVSAVLVAACCIFFVLAFLDLRNSLCIADAVEPHVAPFQEMRALESLPSGLLPRSGQGAELEHLGLGQNGGDHEYHVLVDDHNEGQVNGIRVMPTVMAMRTIGTLDVGLAEHLCESGRDSLKRSSFRLKVNMLLIVVVLSAWLFIFVEAQMSKQDLAQAIQGLGPASPSLPLSIRLSFSFYLLIGVAIFIGLLISLQPRLLRQDLKSLNFFSSQRLPMRAAYAPPVRE